jgi:hypothetical protein
MSECFAISLCTFRHGREIGQPYRSWGLKIFATFHSASKIFSGWTEVQGQPSIIAGDAVFLQPLPNKSSVGALFGIDLIKKQAN